jgi:hypothetical protein
MVNCLDFAPTNTTVSCFDSSRNESCYDWVIKSCYKIGLGCSLSTVHKIGCHELIEREINRTTYGMLSIVLVQLFIMVSFSRNNIMDFMARA